MTLSIVSRDAETGQLGVPVESCSVAVGDVVPWARAGVGAVATQAMTWEIVIRSFVDKGLVSLPAGVTMEDVFG